MPSSPLRVGDRLYGYCGGAFGRDSYDDKRVEGVGSDWVVARETRSGEVFFARGDPESLAAYRERDPDDL